MFAFLYYLRRFSLKVTCKHETLFVVPLVIRPSYCPYPVYNLYIQLLVCYVIVCSRCLRTITFTHWNLQLVAFHFLEFFLHTEYPVNSGRSGACRSNARSNHHMYNLYWCIRIQLITCLQFLSNSLRVHILCATTKAGSETCLKCFIDDGGKNKKTFCFFLHVCLKE